MLRGSNYLDTRPAGSYNRRPLSLGALSPKDKPVKFGFCMFGSLFNYERSSKGIYGDDDPINPHRQK